MPKKILEVRGFRWFDKKNGNTYCSAQCRVNGRLVAVAPFEYGYGEYYLQSAGDALEKAGIITRERLNSGGYRALWSIIKNDLKWDFEYSVQDGLKKDCVAFGAVEI